MRRRLRRVLLVLLLVAGLFEGAYLVGANLLLRSDWLSSFISRKPEKLNVEWTGAWTIVPGRVHAAALRIRGQNRRVQWFAAADEVRMAIDLVPLAFKRFRATNVSARALTFRLGQRVDAEQAWDADPALLPPIPGLSNPPHPAPEDVYPPPSTGNPWRFVLRDIDIEEIKQIWINEFNYQGNGRIRGGFAFRIRGGLAVEDGSIELLAGALKIGERTVAERVQAHLDGSLSRFVPRQQRVVDTFQYFSGTLDVRAGVRSLAFVNLFTRKAPWLAIDGEGDLETKLAVQRGRLLPTSRLALDSQRISARFPHYEARGSGTLQGRVEPRQDGSAAEIAVRFRDFAIARAESDQASIEGQGFDILATVHDPVLGTGFQELDLTIALSESRVTSFDVTNFYFPPRSGFTIRRGSGTLRGRLEMHTATRSGRGELELSGQGVEVQFEDLRIVGDVRIQGRLSETAPRELDGDESYSFDISGSSLGLNHVLTSNRPSSPEAGNWWATLEIEKGTMRLGEPLLLQATLHADMLDSSPIVAVFTEKKPIVKWFDGLLTVKSVKLAADIELGEAIDLRHLHMTGRNMEVLARLRFADQASQGILFVKHGGLSVGVELKDGRRDWKLFNAREWYDRAAGKRLP